MFEGFDTTANTMAFALVHLAIYPEWQEWIREEIDKQASAGLSIVYDKCYPKMKRTLALMVMFNAFELVEILADRISL